MRAWQIETLGSAPVMRDLPRPVPTAGQALVAIEACGLNFADLLMAEGRYQERPALPFIPGLECAGTVLALGPDTIGPAPGTRVACNAGIGGLAEAGAFPVETLVPIPDALSFEQAAGFQIAYGTSHLALSHLARLQPSETLLVLGAAGGVGLTAVEIGAALGARVIACARGPEKLAIARAAGASVTIDSDTPDLKAVLKALGGVDVVYDPVGGDAFAAALRATRPGGRILTIGFASGSVPQIPANLLLVKNLSVIGLWWGGYAKFAPGTVSATLSTLFDWFAAGRLSPHISHVLPFDALPGGLDLLRSRAAIGKVILRTRA
ncbi:zinc-binding dehydrogenase [Gemmobacter aquarius]|uniref:Zinc-binding dehydrogenase n=1 Tax=Paragemmobacter aquarius TaxID=2169400 RepID=A0A2S0URD3_9RHOB|nr:NADPH:quinone oxidoreductase family protein [Gemmobacter aquarius]AWB50374.1 zinc-binding dehydrogenase [Gemmobacter aquarius]